MAISGGGLSCAVCLLLVAHLITYSYGYTFYDIDKRQDLVPFPRVGRSSWSYDPRVGKRQELIPFPRIGRAWDDLDDYYDDWDDVSYVLIPYKRNLFTPRIGRRKRSTNPDDTNSSGDDAELAKTLQQNPWELVGWVENMGRNEENNYDRNMRQLIPHPRVGRGEVQLRAAFVPRLGRKRSEEDQKRPSSFTPRIGRAMFTPRIGRSDQQFSVSGRAFTPRLGRAQFTPRIGRRSSEKSEDTTATKTESA